MKMSMKINNHSENQPANGYRREEAKKKTK